MHQITLTVSQNVLMNHIIQINNNFTACVQTVASSMHTSQAVAPLVNRSLDHVLFKTNRSLRQANFLQVISVTNLCFVHALLHITPNLIVYRSISTNHIRYV